MRILITNDDGVTAPGIHALLDWTLCALPVILRNAPEEGCFPAGPLDVTVIAPLEEQSARSQALNLRAPFKIRRKEWPEFPGIRVFGVGSTPADCVRFGLYGLEESFDLVLSGINRGYNVGGDLVYSGTVGAVYESASAGIPSVALSTDPETLDGVYDSLDMAFRYIVTHDLLSRHLLYNVNLPPCPQGLYITRQGGPYYMDHLVPDGANHYRQVGYCAYEDTHTTELDTDAVTAHCISITPLTLNRTDMAVYEALRSET